MTLNSTPIGPNPQLPGVGSELFVPDQLIAGDLKLVTSGLIQLTGGAVLQRGSVLGRVMEGAIGGSTGKVRGSGTVTVAVLPAVGDTLTVNGTVITFVAANPVGNQVVIGPDLNTTAQNLQAFLSASVDVNISKMLYTIANAVVTATAIVYGTAGNAYTLATSNAGAFTLSGASLAGGTANTGNATLSAMSGGPALQPGTYLATCTDATHAQVTDPLGNEIGIATFGTAFVSPQVNFTITAGGVACAAGDIFAFTPAAGSGKYKLATANATDGSEVPDAILVDYADASAGDCNCGAYRTGEFNVNKLILGQGITVAICSQAFRTRGIFLKSVITADPES